MDTCDFASVARRYAVLAESGRVKHDQAQQDLAHRLDTLLGAIRDARMSSKSSALGWLFAKRRAEAGRHRVKGLYIQGDVGTGKTMLMDMFYDAVPARRKRRVHFHDFMADVHTRVHVHRQALKNGETDEEDPIPPVAAALYEEAWVLCFDEFSVTDIADAMIMSRLFTKLFQKGCVLVATSNVMPRDLYRDGLNRDLFLPFVDGLERHVDVVTLDAKTDYRLEKEGRLPVYVWPLGDKAQAAMDSAWRQMTGNEKPAAETLANRGRTIEAPVTAAGAARFSFRELCGAPLGASDYAALARRFHTVFIENIPVLDETKRNEAKRFIILIDTLYDMKRRIFASAVASPEMLYAGRKGTEGFEFERTASRLVEMQSSEYIDLVEGTERDRWRPAR